MNICWKKGFIGMLLFLVAPLTLLAGVTTSAKGVVQNIGVGYSGGLEGPFHIWALINGNRIYLSSTVDSIHHQAVLSLLVYSKGAGNNVSLINHINSDTSIFDEVVLETN